MKNKTKTINSLNKLALIEQSKGFDEARVTASVKLALEKNISLEDILAHNPQLLPQVKKYTIKKYLELKQQEQL